MQHGDRGSAGRPRSTGAARLARGVALAALPPSIALLTAGTAAAAEAASRLDTLAMLSRTLQTMPRGQLFLLSLGVGLAAFTITVCVVMLWTRRRLVETEAAARKEIVALQARLDRADALMTVDPQVLIVWPSRDGTPEVIGNPGVIGLGRQGEPLLAFGTWLDAEHALAFERAVTALRERGEGFSMRLATSAGRPLEALGRAIGGRAVLRLLDVSGARREVADMTLRVDAMTRELAALKALVEAMPMPVWVRDRSGALTYANPAYVRAVEAASLPAVLKARTELLDSGDRGEASQRLARGAVFAKRLTAVAGGDRRAFDVLEAPAGAGSAGIAADVTGLVRAEELIAREREWHQRTLDRLPTGVAMFGPDRKLVFYNAAYRALWQLDAGFLDQNPTDGMVLDRLRGMRKLEERPDWRNWMADFHEVYQALEPVEDTWHLPDGRTIHVTANPNPQGGVTYLFDDATARYDLESRYNALAQVQSETLDSLKEAVAVFGSDGRLKLHNPSFADLWKLDVATLGANPHIERLVAASRGLAPDDKMWATVRDAVVSLDDQRLTHSGRALKLDGQVIDYATTPLLDGATLVTFRDVTATVDFERAMLEKNEALEQAVKVKTTFLGHMNYELRVPLTSIMGFTDLLLDKSTGELNKRQHDYLTYIASSSASLEALVIDILSVTSIDAGIMTVELDQVDIRQIAEEAAAELHERLSEKDLQLAVDIAPEAAALTADPRHVRQILAKLLANAAGFSPSGATIGVAARRVGGDTVLTVSDVGPGIPADKLGRIFDRFETDVQRSGHRGVGLGLSIVKSLVELHGGRVEVVSRPGFGTSVSCVFPSAHPAKREAAE